MPSPAIASSTTQLATSVAISRFRRRTRSTITPATRPNSRDGNHCADRTQPISSWSARRMWIISSCNDKPKMKVPKVDKPSASQSRTKPG